VTGAEAASSANVTQIRAATTSEWRSAFDADEHATFFHGPAWSELWHVYTEGAMKPDPRLVEFDDGTSAILGVTKVPTRIPGVTYDALSPEGNCGGWVSADDLGEAHGKALADVVLRASAYVWRVGPTDENARSAAPDGGRKEFTQLIDLREGAEAARARWRPSARRAVAQASRRGARLVEGTRRQHWEAYRRLYHASVQRWERPLFTYGDSLFSLLADGADVGIRLWLVELDGEPCAGTVVLVHRRHATSWQGATMPRRCPGAMNFLDWELLQLLADEGVWTYDLGGSAGLSGVVKYKETLGAVGARVVAYERRHPLEHAARRAKRLLVWQR
jgi:hypothetical protein